MNDRPTFAVRDWDKIFEIAQSRKIDGPLKWLAVPTKHDGKGLRRLLKMEQGLGMFGAFILILEVAAKCPKRGVLADEDGPITAEDLELKTGAPAAAFEETLRVLTDPKIGWLTCTGGSPDLSDADPVSGKNGSVLPLVSHSNGSGLPPQYSTRQDITSQNSTSSSSDSSTPSPPAKEKSPSSLLEEELVELWSAAEGVRPIRGAKLTEKRRLQFRRRIADPDWDFRAAIAKFPLLMVATDTRPDPWKPDMDWFLKPDSVQSILEGKYDFSYGARPGLGEVYNPKPQGDGDEGKW